MDGGEWRVSVLVDAYIISVGGAGTGYMYRLTHGFEGVTGYNPR